MSQRKATRNDRRPPSDLMMSGGGANQSGIRSSQNNKSLVQMMSSTQSGKDKNDPVLNLMNEAFVKQAEKMFFQQNPNCQTPPPATDSRMTHLDPTTIGHRTGGQPTAAATPLKPHNTHLQAPSSYHRAASTQAGTKSISMHHHHHKAHSNSSRGGESVNSKHRKSAKSLRYSSCGGDSNQDDRAFVYPCHAFKQFVLTLKEGKIDLNNLGNDTLREVMNKSSDLGKAYEKIYNKIQHDQNHQHHQQRLSVSNIKQQQSVNRLAYAQRCTATCCRSSSQGSENNSNYEDTHHHSRIHHNLSGGEGGLSASSFGGGKLKKTSTMAPTSRFMGSSAAKTSLKDPILEVESHGGSPLQSPNNNQHLLYRTPAQFSTNQNTPAQPQLRPDAQLLQQPKRLSTDNTADPDNPWNIISSTPSKKDLHSPFASIKKSTTTKTQHKPSQSLQLFPKAIPPHPTGNSSKKSGHYMIDASQPSNFSKNSHKKVKIEQGNQPTQSEGKWSSSNYNEKPEEYKAIKSPEISRPYQLSSSGGSLTRGVGEQQRKNNKQNKNAKRDQPDNTFSRDFDTFDPRIPPSDQPIRGLDRFTPTKGDPFPSSLYGHHPPSSSIQGSPSKQQYDPSRHSKPIAASQQTFDKNPSANSVQLSPSKKDRLVQKKLENGGMIKSYKTERGGERGGGAGGEKQNKSQYYAGKGQDTRKREKQQQQQALVFSNREMEDDTPINQASPVFQQSNYNQGSTPQIRPSAFSPHIPNNPTSLNSRRQQRDPGSHSVDRVVGIWEAPLPTNTSKELQYQQQQQPMPAEEMIYVDYQGMKRQGSVGDGGFMIPEGAISPIIPPEYYPEHHRSTASLNTQSQQAAKRNNSGKKKKGLRQYLNDVQPSMPNLSGLISADPSRDEYGEERTSSKNFNQRVKIPNNNHQAEEDEELGELSATTSYYTSQLNRLNKHVDLTYHAQPYLGMPKQVKPEDFKLTSSQQQSPTKFLKQPNKSTAITPKQQSSAQRSKKADNSPLKMSESRVNQNSLNLSHLQSPQVVQQKELHDTMPSGLPLNLQIEMAGRGKDDTGGNTQIGIYAGGSFSGPPKQPASKLRSTRAERRSRRQSANQRPTDGSSLNGGQAPLQEELMRMIMNDISGLKESDVRDITTLRDNNKINPPEFVPQRLSSPIQREQYLNGESRQYLPQKNSLQTPVPVSKQVFTPIQGGNNGNSTQKFEALKNKVDNIKEFDSSSNNQNEAVGIQQISVQGKFSGRRSRQERSGSSSGENDKKQRGNSPEQDLTLQNFIKQLSGTQKILSPKESQGSHFQRKKSSLIDLPKIDSSNSKKVVPQPRPPPARGEIYDEFDYRSKSPKNETLQIARPKDTFGITRSGIKSQADQQISPAKTNIQSFTLNPYNQSLPQSAQSHPQYLNDLNNFDVARISEEIKMSEKKKYENFMQKKDTSVSASKQLASKDPRSYNTPSKIQQIGEKIQNSINKNGLKMKSIDYRLINQLQTEAATVIQRNWRKYQQRINKRRGIMRREQPSGEGSLTPTSVARTCKHGNNLCDRGTATTSPFAKNGTHNCGCECIRKLAGTFDQEKLQMFLASTVHSYMMLNCIMADAKFENCSCFTNQKK